MLILFLRKYIDPIVGSESMAYIATYVIWGLILFMLLFVSNLLKEKRRNSGAAFIFQLISPGSGFAYAGSKPLAFTTLLISIVFVIFNKMFSENMTVILFLIIFIGPAFLSGTYADKAHRIYREKIKDMKKKEWEGRQNEVSESYYNGLNDYIKRGSHVAVDTNFLMHYHHVLLRLYKEADFHLFLHPTVFGELEGLKKSNKKEVRAAAQIGFDILELYQKSHRLQWTRKQSVGGNFSNADQRIVTGVLSEIEKGVNLVFASHDKGARILARSLNIPCVDPYYQKQQVSG